MGGCRAAWAIFALSLVHASSSEFPAMQLDASLQARHRGLGAQNSILRSSKFKETIAFSYPTVRVFNHFRKASLAVPGTQHRGGAVAVRCDLDFHEAQQSRQYNLAKVQGGYYSHDLTGKVDDNFNNVINKRMKTATFLDSADALVNKYMPSLDTADPIISALFDVCKATSVRGYEMLDKRWNGNEVLKYTTDAGYFFVKLNRETHKSVLMSEAVSLTSILRTKTIRAPKPLHVGVLPKVGEVGPGSFLIVEYLPLAPFGAMRPGMQAELGSNLADLHLSKALEDVHKGRFGFVGNNFLSRTPVDNTWDKSWSNFFGRRLEALIKMSSQDKDYSRAAVSANDEEFSSLGQRTVERAKGLLDAVDVSPSLLHGDLWIGNAGGTTAGEAVVFDPACFFGHSEFDLVITKMFGGYTEQFYEAYHAKIPRQEGFEEREGVYMLYHFLNQLNLFGDSYVRSKCVEVMYDILGETPPDRDAGGAQLVPTPKGTIALSDGVGGDVYLQ